MYYPLGEPPIVNKSNYTDTQLQIEESPQVVRTVVVEVAGVSVTFGAPVGLKMWADEVCFMVCQIQNNLASARRHLIGRKMFFCPTITAIYLPVICFQVMVVKPEALFWAEVKDEFPLVAMYAFTRSEMNSANLEEVKAFDQHALIVMTYPETTVTYIRYEPQFQSADTGWTVAQINLDMLVFRVDLPQNTVLMVSIRNITGFPKETTDRYLVRME